MQRTGGLPPRRPEPAVAPPNMAHEPEDRNHMGMVPAFTVGGHPLFGALFATAMVSPLRKAQNRLYKAMIILINE